MGMAHALHQVPIVETGPVPIHFFNDFELEVFGDRCARFVLLQDHKPHYLDGGAERTMEVKVITCVDLLPGMIGKLIFELGRQWHRDWIKGLLLPLQ